MSVVTNEVWRFSLSKLGRNLEAQWEYIAPVLTDGVPAPRFDHAAVSFRNTSVLIYGGCEGGLTYGDVWLLKPASAVRYIWQRIPPSPPSLPPPLPVCGNDIALLQSDIPASPPTPSSPPGETPGARCAHSAVPTGNGMVIFGGRIPRAHVAGPSGRRSSNEPTWQMLSDLWIFSVEQALDASPSNGWTFLPFEGDRANRSDHTSVLLDGNLLVFGGLYTDIKKGTIYKKRLETQKADLSKM